MHLNTTKCIPAGSTLASLLPLSEVVLGSIVCMAAWGQSSLSSRCLNVLSKSTSKWKIHVFLDTVVGTQYMYLCSDRILFPVKHKNEQLTIVQGSLALANASITTVTIKFYGVWCISVANAPQSRRHFCSHLGLWQLVGVAHTHTKHLHVIFVVLKL